VVSRRNSTKRFLFAFILLLALVAFIFYSSTSSKTNNKNTFLSTEEEEYILYGSYVAVNSSVELREESVISWRFWSSNPNVDIFVYAMTLEEFQQFENNQNTGVKVTLSSNEHIDSGNYTILTKAVWVIVFYNIDDNMLAVNLNYAVEFYAKGINPWLINGPIIGGTFLITSLSGLFYVLIRKKKQLPILPMSKKYKEAYHLLNDYKLEQNKDNKIKIIKQIGETKSKKAAFSLISLINEYNDKDLLFALFDSLILINSTLVIPKLKRVFESTPDSTKRKLADLAIYRIKNKSEKPLPKAEEKIDLEIELEKAKRITMAIRIFRPPISTYFRIFGSIPIFYVKSCIYGCCCMLWNITFYIVFGVVAFPIWLLFRAFRFVKISEDKIQVKGVLSNKIIDFDEIVNITIQGTVVHRSVDTYRNFMKVSSRAIDDSGEPHSIKLLLKTFSQGLVIVDLNKYTFNKGLEILQILVEKLEAQPNISSVILENQLLRINRIDLL